MKFAEFSAVLSRPGMSRYVAACAGDTKKAMTLYRLNLRLSQELFAIISCFEVALRNRICKHYTTIYGNNWLRDSARTGGIFDNYRCRIARNIINAAVTELVNAGNYTHYKLMAASYLPCKTAKLAGYKL